MRAEGAVRDSQRAYRSLLRATANPGELVGLPAAGGESPELVLKTLLDHEVAFCVVGGGAWETEERLSLATGARVVSPGEANFVLVLGGSSQGQVLSLKRGTLEEPAEGATVVYAVGRLAERGPLTVSLSGPGVPGERSVGVDGLTGEEIEAIRETRFGFPMGVDVYLVDGEDAVVGLPRSTRVEVIS